MTARSSISPKDSIIGVRKVPGGAIKILSHSDGSDDEQTQPGGISGREAKMLDINNRVPKKVPRLQTVNSSNRPTLGNYEADASSVDRISSVANLS